MRCFARVLVFGILSVATGTGLQAQHTGLQRGTAAPSSTAIGAGALSFGPSSTARGTEPAHVSIYTPGFRGPGLRGGTATRSRGSNGRNYRTLPFAYWIAPYYYGGLDFSDTSEAPTAYEQSYDPAADPNAVAAIQAQQALAQQLQRLTAQVAQLQNAQQPQQMPLPEALQPQQPEPPSVPITVVLRNGQQLQVQNYAVMNETFWDLSKQPARKIPLSSIDVGASTRATEANGGEFPSLPMP